MNPDAPSDQFFLEYVHRPPKAEMFFEDVLMAIHFYGMPILVENNKPGLLHYLARRGYKGYCLKRPDKFANRLNANEVETGGIPSTEQVIMRHAEALEAYIEEHVGVGENGNIGNMYFNRTLEDWVRYKINDRTAFDATVSSGLALMACYKISTSHLENKKQLMSNPFKTYSQSGQISQQIIE